MPQAQSTAMTLQQKPTMAMTFKDAEVWVKKWVDYSSKYGLGYLLSDSTTGIYFNDSTKMVID